MELKDKLKALRKEKGLTQAQLAEILFVSRSTVAKWENGLGLPAQDSMEALKRLYGISQDQVATSEPETVIVEKNKKLHLLGQIIGWTVTLLLCAVATVLPVAIHKGNYGFTPAMAAGGLKDCPYIDIDEYRIYYGQFEGDWDDGRHWSDLSYFRVIKKHFWGCTVVDTHATRKVISNNNYIVGHLHTFKGKNGYYNIIMKAKTYHVKETGAPLIWGIPEELITAEAVTIGKTIYPLTKNFLFTTQTQVEIFEIDEQRFFIE